jgi:alpha-D-ribose 1-methylphosphonate 5-triphosphate synthase subunit PhnH
MTEGERLVRKLTKAQFKEVAEIIAMGDVGDLARVASAQTGYTPIQVAIAAVLVRVIEHGDMVSLDRLLDRLIGKVKDEVDHTFKPLTIKRRDGSEVVLDRQRDEGEE